MTNNSIGCHLLIFEWVEPFEGADTPDGRIQGWF